MPLFPWSVHPKRPITSMRSDKERKWAPVSAFDNQGREGNPENSRTPTQTWAARTTELDESLLWAEANRLSLFAVPFMNWVVSGGALHARNISCTSICCLEYRRSSFQSPHIRSWAHVALLTRTSPLGRWALRSLWSCFMARSMQTLYYACAVDRALRCQQWSCNVEHHIPWWFLSCTPRAFTSNNI